ncbi:MAG: chromosome segregation protein SMC [Clostridiales bacterium]|nr:chromosome segregation protein SMC [Clostridiales bacterium]
MYLKALEIQGFKSFPDKTVLNFGADITAIVGPNGSGKSNISDAILWVMGEQNSRQLRGAKMEDVIFGGTEKRNQMGFEQVTLVIDNTEHIFPMDEIEVAVTRRYYRSGESEYYINKQSVRLKDVSELFMDTGMGREGYSIIGQGKIDEILSVKSEDRREIFEEAAGISKFRHRKEESERKLSRTQENLVRINDKISELELQVEPLREQAETAKKYLVLRDELRVLEISVWLENLQAIKTNSFKLQSDFEAAQAEQQRAQAALDAVYAEAEQAGDAMHQNDMDAEAVRSQMAGLDTVIGEEESAVAVLRTGVTHNEENMNRIGQELTDVQTRSGNLQNQVDALNARLAEIEASCETLNDDLAELLQSAEETAKSAGGAAAEVEALRAKEALKVSAAADTKAELSALAAGEAQMEERRTAAQSELSTTGQKQSETEQEAKANRRALTDAKEEAEAIGNIIGGHSLKMASRQKRDEAAAAAKLQLTMDVNAMQSRIRLLSDMEKEYEGFSKAVRLVMLSAEKNTLRGIHGPVASLMTTDARYTVALEIALGAGLQNIVVDREEDAKAAIGYLKQRDGGRATFLPLSAIRGEELREPRLADEYGFVGIASDLVTFDPQYANIFKNLLGRTVIVEDMDCGIAMARKFGNRFRIVTLDGQVINRGGSMTGGSVNQKSGVLSRANELEGLQKKLSAMEQKLAQAVKEQEEAHRELTRAQYELETAQSQQRQAEDAVLKLEGQQSHYDILLTALKTNCDTLKQELSTISGRREENKTRRESLQKTLETLEKEAGDFRAQAEERLTGQSGLLEKSSHLSDAISEKKAALAALAAERESTQRNMDDLRQLRQDMLLDEESRRKLSDEFRAANEKAAMEIEEHEKKIGTLRMQAEQCRSQLTRLAEEKLQLEARRGAKDKESRECNDSLLNTERSVSQLEQKINSAAMEEKQILDRLWEHYELSHADAMEQRVELESVPKATRRIGELNREIKSLGNPNIGAIEEFDRVNTRYTYLSEQRTDVEKAREELEGVIDQITRQMTEIFGEQFKILNESFQETFLELFGGGRAHLELEDENDILNCGIEIKVQPPGKQLKTITLLSGGEKAFVAIALYFAILKVHPTPFCVMDEIEAALDEANVTRYAKYMRRIAGKTQFIVITHRRGTMEEADVLYGVTMQERGVSKILTINLNDMARELKIK